MHVSGQAVFWNMLRSYLSESDLLEPSSIRRQMEIFNFRGKMGLIDVRKLLRQTWGFLCSCQRPRDPPGHLQ